MDVYISLRTHGQKCLDLTKICHRGFNFKKTTTSKHNFYRSPGNSFTFAIRKKLGSCIVWPGMLEWKAFTTIKIETATYIDIVWECVYVCVCVCEREREREGFLSMHESLHVSKCVCVGVYVGAYSTVWCAVSVIVCVLSVCVPCSSSSPSVSSWTLQSYEDISVFSRRQP